MNAPRAIFQYLDDQHALLELGLGAIERAVAGHAFVDAGRRLAAFQGHLRRYVRAEEKVLFPIYEGLPSMQLEPTTRMREEHGQLARMLVSLAPIVRGEDEGRALEALATVRDVLFLHGLKENWMIYPRLVDAMPAAVQESMIRALREGARPAS